LVFPIDFPQDDDGSGQHEQVEIVPVHFFITHQEFPKPIKPRVANLDNPTPCLETDFSVPFVLMTIQGFKITYFISNAKE
jgi:hypothetical protein